MFPVDFHDDLGELLLRNPDSVETELLKTASWKERDALYDRDFAVILVDEQGKEHRKFACYDAGTTAASVIYLLHGCEQLSPGATKLAATNLIASAEYYGLELPEDMETLTQLPASSAQVDTRRIYEYASTVKLAAMPGKIVNIGQKIPIGKTWKVRVKKPAAVKDLAQAAKPVEEAGAAWGLRHVVGAGVGGVGLGAALGVPTGMGMEQSKMASYDMLKEIESSWADLSFEEKRTAAVEVTKLAEAEGASVPQHIWQYAGTQLNPKFASAVIPQRKNYTANEELSELYDRLGAMASYLGPEKTAEALFLLDQQASLTPRYGKNLPDPMLAVWGQEKTAAAKWVYGGDYVNEDQLTRYAAAMTSYHALEQIFSEAFRDKFRANPIATFNAAPLEQKILLARMASQSRESNDGGT